MINDKVRALFAGMDRAYAKVAALYGFDCGGCEENCCTQRFYHYTLTEHYYLHKGLRAAGPARSTVVLEKARKVVGSYSEELKSGRILPLMCPVNFDGLCSLYEHRPMICRLHGLPHEFAAPDGTLKEGGGCHRFNSLHKITLRLDRTGFYAELAGIEKALRERLAFSGRYKKTTAEMLLEPIIAD